MISGVAPHLSVAENVIADKLNFERFVKNGFLRSQSIRKFVIDIIKRYKIACQSPDVSVDSLSGGNIQKVVLARELSSEPKIIIAEQPTRGVDVGATEFIRNELLASRDAGNTVFLISSDLNEILGLSDSLIVLYEGEIVAFFPDASKINEEDLGRYMLGIERQSFEQISEAYSE
jgi:simple sugar transport system ATP-binding protein